MSQETWEILCGMKTDDVELQLALQCAPLITGLKISNLLTISSDGFCLVEKIISGSFISMYPLKVRKTEENEMDKIYVVFWTQGGNTQAMAEAIGEGIREAGKEAEVVFVTGADIEALKAAPKFALGCPAMGAEVLEEAEMEPFVCDVEGFASGKKIALFGSYGWGDGEWMRDWTTRMEAAGATVLNGEGLIFHETPDEDGLNACRELGRQLADA